MNNIKKTQIILIILAGIGLFLPLVKVSIKDVTSSASFMNAPDGKYLLIFLVIALIISIIQLKKDSLTLKILSMIFIIITGVFFFIDASRISTAKKLILAIKYGIGFYLSASTIVASFILGIVDLFNNNNYDNYLTNYPLTNDSLKINNLNIPDNNKISEIDYEEKEIIENKASNNLKMDDLANHNRNNNLPSKSRSDVKNNQ